MTNNYSLQTLLDQLETSPIIQFYLRDFYPGEYFDPITQLCQLCPPGLYSLNISLQCALCPSQDVLCLGGDNLDISRGYWMSDNGTFFPCANDIRCQGGLN